MRPDRFDLWVPIVVAIDSVLDASKADARVEIDILDAATYSPIAMIWVQAGTLHDLVNNSVPWDPIAMRWWRFRPVASSDTAFDTSPDGVTWTPHGQYTDMPNGAVLMVITAGATTPGAAGTARFAYAGACQ